MAEQTIQAFTKGVHNVLDDEIIPADAASDSQNFVTIDGKIMLAYGRKLVGTEGLVGTVRGLHYGYKRDGTKVLYRKINTIIQYWTGTTWSDVITGLTAADEYSFANYSSLSGSFTFISGPGGFWKINNENPGSAIDLYDIEKNDKGKILIDRKRLLMWDCANASKTALKLSYIDTVDSAYDLAENETIGAAGAQVYAGSLAFKAANSKANCFGVMIAGAYGTTLNIISASAATDCVIGFEGIYTNTWIAANDYVTIHQAGDMAELDNTIARVVSVSGTTITIDTDSSAYTPYGAPPALGNVGSIAKAELLNDDKDGTLSSTGGGTGTINYATGAYTTDFLVNTTLTPVTEYQYEDSTVYGLADFTYSADRVPGEGNIFNQDIGGDAILNVVLGQDGKYYSLKEQSAYELDVPTDDDNSKYTNLVYRRDIGIPFWRGAVSTSKGIVFINTANPDSPELTILQRNPLGDNIEPVVLFPHFDFSDYDYTYGVVDTWEKYVLVGCMREGKSANDTILLCDMVQGSVDIIRYNANCFAKDSGNLYIGSSITQSVYQIFNGFDDDGVKLDNYWISKGEKFFKEELLKKFRKLIFKGHISRPQSVSVYISYDDGGYALVGTISGAGTYVDVGNPQTIGANMIGTEEVGLGLGTTINPFMCELKVPKNKFRKRNIKLVADGIGYFDLVRLTDWDLMQFERRIPSRYRTKQT